MDDHCGYQSGIVSVLTQNSVSNYLPLPFFQERDLRQQNEESLECIDLCRCLFRREAEAIFTNGSRNRRAELNEVLRREIQHLLFVTEGPERVFGGWAMGMMWLQKTQQDVGVQEDSH